MIRAEVSVQIRLGRIRNAYAWSDLNGRTKVGYLKTGD
ncbi:hypothetical protein BX285_6354 [Streptomyces sp. 1114.5]|nr:hypothetical protein BX285_6354 [Streptomyces sp. 1114.5]SOB88736.1 hypothetical protein SAMN06272789_7031 [Streptomyces sp. 1331.2]